MKRELLKSHLRSIVNEVVSAGNDETHRCLNGKVVSMSSPRCVRDLEYRIEDARADRDACPGRTDAREHYNGLLKVLRRKLRRAQKLQL